jgi:hypothetical protein
MSCCTTRHCSANCVYHCPLTCLQGCPYLSAPHTHCVVVDTILQFVQYMQALVSAYSVVPLRKRVYIKIDGLLLVSAASCVNKLCITLLQSLIGT